MYKKIDLSNIPNEVSEDAAKAIIDWRISSKKGISQRIFDNAIKIGLECVRMGYYETIDDVFLRWEESGWTGIKYVLKEAEREAAQSTVIHGRFQVNQQDFLTPTIGRVYDA